MRRNAIFDLLKALVLALAIIVVVVLLFGCQKSTTNGTGGTSNGQEAVEKTVYVYIPCGMREPFDQAIAMFNKAHEEVQVKGMFDNAVVLVRKIENEGDTPDLIVTPGEVEMNHLVEVGEVDAANVTDIGTYDLAVVVPRENPAGVTSIEDLVKPEVKRVAIADPELNSVGYYAKQSLESLGLWEQVKDKAVSPEHALDVVSFAAKEKVDVTLAYESCPLQSAPEKADKERLIIVSRVPADAHSPILVKIGLLNESFNPKWAKEFAKFLITDEVQSVFQEVGLPRLSNLEEVQSDQNSP